MRLLLFDVDDTLVKPDAGKTHSEAFTYAMKKVFKVDADIYDVNPSGKVDSQILIETLGLHNIDENTVQNNFPELFSLMIDYVRDNMSDLSSYVLADVKESLELLSQNNDVIIGLLTGNIEDIAWTKMERAGLRQYFKTGAFGNQALRRSKLVPIALSKVADFGITANKTYIIGDTPSDVKCAKDNGCNSIAITSGDFSAVELKNEKPDYLIANPLEILDIIK